MENYFWTALSSVIWDKILFFKKKKVCIVPINAKNSQIKILAYSANTKCRPFQVKINCSKFIIDGLRQRCHITFLVSLFITSRNSLFGEFLPRKIITILQANVTERWTSLSKRSGMFRQNISKVTVKKLNL